MPVLSSAAPAGKGRGKKILLPFQLAVLLGMSITYVLVGGENLMAFAKSIAPHGSAVPGKWSFIVMFGGLELFLSMVSGMAGQTSPVTVPQWQCTSLRSQRGWQVPDWHSCPTARLSPYLPPGGARLLLMAHGVFKQAAWSLVALLTNTTPASCPPAFPPACLCCCRCPASTTPACAACWAPS